jgi:hypothetical protein
MTVSVAGRTRVAVSGQGVPAGPPGVDGRTIENGFGLPPKNFGRDGDFWIDRTKNRLYGPKDRGLWDLTKYVTLKGLKGDKGPGILHSNGPPRVAWGQVNDFYIDVDAQVLYGPKTKTGWPAEGIALVTFISGFGAPSNSLGVDGQTYYDKTNLAIYGPKDGGVWPAGVSLVVVLTGTGAPSNALGLIGQLYVDTTNGVIYGPKTGTGWSPHPLRFTLIGSGAPSNSVGVDGQIFFDMTNAALYGPKAGGIWPAGIGLRGPLGLKPIEPWVTGTSYVTGPPASWVRQGNATYQALIAHTAGVFATDLGAGRWGLVTQDGAAGTGSGTVIHSGSVTPGNIAGFGDSSGDLIVDIGPPMTNGKVLALSGVNPFGY